MKVYDCCIFYNEVDMLKFRLEELYENVDYFVIVDGKKTFTGKEITSIFKENENQFEKFKNKIIHHTVDNMNFENPWNNETKQRDGIGEVLNILNLKDNDVIILSDCDEIPDVNTIDNFKKNYVNGIYSLSQDFYYYNLNSKFTYKWGKSKIGRWGDIKKYGSTDRIRYIDFDSIPNGGWHFSYFGDSNFIKNKIENFSHQEYNNEDYKSQEHINNCIQNKRSLFNESYLIDISLEENDYLPKQYKMLIK
jgi:beta-1,4-mannosyl-glycoprotein beta-1,4-N-acetylglucosaminyltransferase